MSHVCAVFIFAMFIAVNAFLLFHGVRDIPSIVIALCCAVQLLGMFVAPQDRRQHSLGTVLLVLIAMDAFYDMAAVPGYRLYKHDPAIHGTWATIFVNAVACCILLLLAYDFAFGAESRAFFKQPPKKK